VELDEGYCAAHVGAASGPHVMLAVTDTGTGWTSDASPDVRAVLHDQGEGKGRPGLATVFESCSRAGATSGCIASPARARPSRCTSHEPTPKRSSTQGPRLVRSGDRHGRWHRDILLVEDEESVRVLARTILRRFGYHVLEAQSGGDALLICEQHLSEIHLMLTMWSCRA